MRNPQRIREPAVAGMFYPAPPQVLAAEVDALLAAATPPPSPDPIVALLSPHAGYAYSGAVAAEAFAALRAEAAAGTAAPPTVVIVGPSHVEAFSHTSVFDGEAYRTPLGYVPVHSEIALALAACDDSIRCGDAGHVLRGHTRGEHGIEVILPFLQCVYRGASIVPIVMGVQSPAAARILGDALARVCDPLTTLLIASSDLSHFYDDAKACALDAVFCAAFEKMDADALMEAVEAGTTEACGAGPVAAVMHAIAARGGTHTASVLAACNSGDVTGERDSVVGYASGLITRSRA